MRGRILAALADEVVGVNATHAEKWQRTLPTLAGRREEYPNVDNLRK